MMDLLSPYIKTPQLIGIVAGCAVFSITIGVVVYLLVASGSLAKLAEELQAEVNPKNGKNKKKSEDLHPRFSSIPELYDELIKARDILPLRPNPPFLTGRDVCIRKFSDGDDTAELSAVSDGRAIFHESSYDPTRIWGWIDATIRKVTSLNSESLVIVDSELNRSIGMLTLLDNCPHDLSIRIGNMWITPAFQGQKRAHETMLLILEWLHRAGYRRITAEVDERHIIARKFLERCGFQLEATLRKHRIIQNRNSNTALYVVLNSEFEDVERKLKSLLNISLAPKLHKIAEIDKPGDTLSVMAVGQERKTAGEGNAKKRKKKKAHRH